MAGSSTFFRGFLKRNAADTRRLCPETEKRGRDFRKIALEDAISFSEDNTDIDLLALDEAMEQLSTFDPQQSRIVELRFFGGLTIEETAEVLDISPATIKREWTVARSWLYRKIYSCNDAAPK